MCAVPRRQGAFAVAFNAAKSPKLAENCGIVFWGRECPMK